MKKSFTLIIGFLLFASAYFHVKRQNSYLANQPAADAKTIIQTSPVNTFATSTQRSFAFHLVSNR